MHDVRSIVRVVGAAVLRDGACLATRRGAGGEAAFQWEFPGGKIEPGETPRDALRREVAEELDVEIEVGPWLGRGVHSSDDRTIELDVYTARIVAGEVRLREHSSCGWFRTGEIDGLNWAAADRPVLPALKQLLGA